MANSVVIEKMVSLRIIGQRLMQLADSMLTDELKYGWDVDAERTRQTLALASAEHAAKNPCSIDELAHGLCRVASPIVEALARLEREDGNREAAGA